MWKVVNLKHEVVTTLGNTVRNISFMHMVVSFIYITESYIFSNPEEIVILITKLTKYFCQKIFLFIDWILKRAAEEERKKLKNHGQLSVPNFLVSRKFIILTYAARDIWVPRVEIKNSLLTSDLASRWLWKTDVEVYEHILEILWEDVISHCKLKEISFPALGIYSLELAFLI